MSRVYASLPLTGPSARLGRDVLRGAELALEREGNDSVELVPLDSLGSDRQQQPIANALRAADDKRALAYLGDFHSAHILVTTPILEDVGLLQVAPVATYVGLAGKTLVRLTPHDGVGARAIAEWLVQARVQNLLVVHDHDHGYGIPVGAMCTEAARDRGLAVRSRPIWNHDEAFVADLGDAQAVLYVGVAGTGAAGLWRDLHEANPALWLLGTDGIAVPWLARDLKPAAAERTRLFVAQRAPFAFYGFEGMVLILDSIAAGNHDRAAVVRAARTTTDRDSVLGRYSIDDHGHTTNTAYGRLIVIGGELVWDV